MSLLDVIGDNVVLNYFDVEVVDSAGTLLMDDVHDVGVLDDVVVNLIPFNEMIHKGIGVDDVDEDVSPLDVMRQAGSTS